jgi:hypothetical protein
VSQILGSRRRGRPSVYFGFAGVALGAAKNGGMVDVGAGSDEALGFNKRNSWAASPAQKLSR